MVDFDFTILTVLYKSDELIVKNLEIFCRTNPNVKVNWILVKNDDPQLESLRVKLEPFQKQIKLTLLPGPPKFMTPYDEGSYHHAAGIHVGLRYVKTRYVAIMDPDFFVVRPGWVGAIVEHMQRSKFDFLGTIWDPCNRSKQHDFPSVHFMVVDTHEVPIHLLDFMPDLDQSEKVRRTTDRMLEVMHTLNGNGLKWIGEKILITVILMKRKCSKDTGIRIRKLFNRESRFYRRHYLLTFVSHFFNLHKTSKVRKLFPKPFKTWLPEMLGIIPKSVNLERTFIRSVDKPFYKAHAWEELLYGKKPFAFHCRRVLNAYRNRLSNVDEPIQDTVERLYCGISYQYFRHHDVVKAQLKRNENECAPVL